MIHLTTRRAVAALAPSTFNREAGTVDVVLSTGAPVKRAGYVERLGVAPENVTLAPHLPVLDSHRQTSIADVLGRVESVRFEPGAIVATLRISNASALAAIERGEITGVSVGYAVRTWTRSADVRTATSWEILEVSLVPVPADPAAIVRGYSVPDDIQPVEATRLEIRSIARAAGLSPEWADAQIDSDADPIAVRAAAFNEIQARPRPAFRTAIVGASSEDPAVALTRQVEALAQRMGGPLADDSAREYLSLGFADHARVALTRASVPGVARMSREDLLQRALHTTSDFPILLEGASNRVLANGYAAAQSPLMALARRRTVPDFRPVTIVKLGGLGTLAEVTESGEITATSTAESGETYAVKTFGRIFGLTRKALINEDLGAFGRIPADLGRAAAETEASAMAALLLANPVMGDGVTLFATAHGNVAGTGAAISEASVSAARLAMRQQVGLTGERIGVTPRYLVVGPALETAAEKFLATINAATTADVSVFAGRLTLLVEPRITGNSWWIFADPAQLAVFEYAALASAQGPQISSRDGWEVLGREFRVTLDFGVAAVEHRGAYRNAGA